MASFLFRGTCLSNIRWLNLLTLALQPGSMKFVPVGSFIIAGPEICCPGFNNDLSYNGIFINSPWLVIVTLSTATASCSTSLFTSSLITDAPPIASTLKASNTSSLSSLENP